MRTGCAGTSPAWQMASGTASTAPPVTPRPLNLYRDVFTECGLATRKQSYEQGGRLGVNVVGQRAGERSRDLRPLLVSAHYDTVCGSPGGDDNASGVAAMLECAPGHVIGAAWQNI